MSGGNVEIIGDGENFFTYVLDPNPVGKELQQHEDLMIYVDFRAIPKSRSIIETDGTFFSDTRSREGVPFIQAQKQGNTKFVTTDFYHVGNGEVNLEGFGIKSISIDMKALTPTVEITFYDARGAGLFDNREYADSGNRLFLDSPLAILFDLPHPMYQLTVKGFYGKAVSYCLHMISVNNRFDAENGGFEINAKFLGVTHAFLADIIMQHVVALSSTEEMKNHLKESGSPSISTWLGKIGGLFNFQNEITEKDNSYFELKALNTLIVLLEDIRNLVGRAQTDASKTVGEQLKLQRTTVGVDHFNFFDYHFVSTAKKKEYTELSDNISILIKKYNTIIDENKAKFKDLEKYKIANTSFSVFDIQLNDAKTMYDRIYNAVNKRNNEQSAALIDKDNVSGFLINGYKYFAVDSHSLRLEIGGLFETLKTAKEVQIEALNTKINQRIEKELGVSLKLEDVFKVLTDNVQGYLKVIYDTAMSADAPEIQAGRIKGLSNTKKDVSDTEGRIYPFPSVYDVNDSGKEKWLGTVVGENNPNFPEIGLVHSILKGMFMQQEDKEKSQQAAQPDTDQFDDDDNVNIIGIRPEFRISDRPEDNHWFPINPADYRTNKYDGIKTFDLVDGVPMNLVNVIVERMLIIWYKSGYNEMLNSSNQPMFFKFACLEASYFLFAQGDAKMRKYLSELDEDKFIKTCIEVYNEKRKNLELLTLGSFDFNTEIGISISEAPISPVLNTFIPKDGIDQGLLNTTLQINGLAPQVQETVDSVKTLLNGSGFDGVRKLLDYNPDAKYTLSYPKLNCLPMFFSFGVDSDGEFHDSRISKPTFSHVVYYDNIAWNNGVLKFLQSVSKANGGYRPVTEKVNNGSFVSRTFYGLRTNSKERILGGVSILLGGKLVGSGVFAGAQAVYGAWNTFRGTYSSAIVSSDSHEVDGGLTSLLSSDNDLSSYGNVDIFAGRCLEQTHVDDGTEWDMTLNTTIDGKISFQKTNFAIGLGFSEFETSDSNFVASVSLNVLHANYLMPLDNDAYGRNYNYIDYFKHDDLGKAYIFLSSLPFKNEHLNFEKFTYVRRRIKGNQEDPYFERQKIQFGDSLNRISDDFKHSFYSYGVKRQDFSFLCKGGNYNMPKLYFVWLCALCWRHNAEKKLKKTNSKKINYKVVNRVANFLSGVFANYELTEVDADPTSVLDLTEHLKYVFNKKRFDNTASTSDNNILYDFLEENNQGGRNLYDTYYRYLDTYEYFNKFGKKYSIDDDIINSKIIDYMASYYEQWVVSDFKKNENKINTYVAAIPLFMRKIQSKVYFDILFDGEDVVKEFYGDDAEQKLGSTVFKELVEFASIDINIINYFQKFYSYEQDFLELYKERIVVTNFDVTKNIKENLTEEEKNKFIPENISDKALTEYFRTWLNCYKTKYNKDPESKSKFLGTPPREEQKLAPYSYKPKTFEDFIRDEDLKLDIYKKLKTIYERWIAGGVPDGKVYNFCEYFGGGNFKKNLFDRFHFIDRTWSYIGDKALVNPRALLFLTNNSNIDMSSFIGRICQSSNLQLHVLPSHVNYRNVEEVKAMFKPHTTLEDVSAGATFVIVYYGGASKALDIKRSYYLNDGFDLRSYASNKIPNGFTSRRLPKNFASLDANEKNRYNMVAFRVGFADQNQSIFKSLNVSQQDSAETAESHFAIGEVLDRKGGNQPFYKPTNLYNLYNLRSYKCEVESLGNMLIQPTQYFQLDNAPMYHGAYWITDVKHDITPHAVITKFTGMRMSVFVYPIIETVLTYLDISTEETLLTQGQLDLEVNVVTIGRNTVDGGDIGDGIMDGTITPPIERPNLEPVVCAGNQFDVEPVTASAAFAKYSAKPEEYTSVWNIPYRSENIHFYIRNDIGITEALNRFKCILNPNKEIPTHGKGTDQCSGWAANIYNSVGLVQMRGNTSKPTQGDLGIGAWNFVFGMPHIGTIYIDPEKYCENGVFKGITVKDLIDEGVPEGAMLFGMYDNKSSFNGALTRTDGTPLANHWTKKTNVYPSMISAIKRNDPVSKIPTKIDHMRKWHKLDRGENRLAALAEGNSRIGNGQKVDWFFPTHTLVFTYDGVFHLVGGKVLKTISKNFRVLFAFDTFKVTTNKALLQDNNPLFRSPFSAFTKPSE